MNLIDYFISNPTAFRRYRQVVDSNLLDAFSRGDRRLIEDFFLKEYYNTKAIYIRLGDPNVAAIYGLNAGQLVDYISISDITVAIFLSYIAELLIARGQIDSLINPLLSISESHAAKAPCKDRLRIKVLSNIYLLKSISEKALGNTSEAYRLLLELDKSNWVRINSNRGMLISVHRQQVMMHQSFQQHLDILEDATRIRAEAPLEYYRTLKRVFEYATNYGYERSVARMMPIILTAYASVRHEVPLISKISILKNLGQANALLGNTDLARLQLDSALLQAKEKDLRGQIGQLNLIKEAVEAGNVVGSLVTFRTE